MEFAKELTQSELLTLLQSFPSTLEVQYMIDTAIERKLNSSKETVALAETTTQTTKVKANTQDANMPEGILTNDMNNLSLYKYNKYNNNNYTNNDADGKTNVTGNASHICAKTSSTRSYSTESNSLTPSRSTSTSEELSLSPLRITSPIRFDEELHDTPTLSSQLSNEETSVTRSINALPSSSTQITEQFVALQTLTPEQYNDHQNTDESNFQSRNVKTDMRTTSTAIIRNGKTEDRDWQELLIRMTMEEMLCRQLPVLVEELVMKEVARQVNATCYTKPSHYTPTIINDTNDSNNNSNNNNLRNENERRREHEDRQIDEHHKTPITESHTCFSSLPPLAHRPPLAPAHSACSVPFIPLSSSTTAPTVNSSLDSTDDNPDTSNINNCTIREEQQHVECLDEATLPSICADKLNVMNATEEEEQEDEVVSQKLQLHYTNTLISADSDKSDSLSRHNCKIKNSDESWMDKVEWGMCVVDLPLFVLRSFSSLREACRNRKCGAVQILSITPNSFVQKHQTLSLHIDKKLHENIDENMECVQVGDVLLAINSICVSSSNAMEIMLSTLVMERQKKMSTDDQKDHECQMPTVTLQLFRPSTQAMLNINVNMGNM